MTPFPRPFALRLLTYVGAFRGAGQRRHGETQGLERQAPPHGPPVRCRKSRSFLKLIGTQPNRKPSFPAMACCRRRRWTSCRGWRRRRCWLRRPGNRVDTQDLRDGSSNRTTRTKEWKLREVYSKSQFQLCLYHETFCPPPPMGGNAASN